MRLDNQHQQQFLLEMIDRSSIPGQAVDFLYHLKRSIMLANIGPE
jgi:hypothetical protein